MSAASEIEVVIEDAGWTARLPHAEGLVEDAARATLAAAPVAAGEGAIAILLTNDDEVRALNARFRGKDSPTNVLSFPAPAGSGMLGDIALALGVCAREAQAQDKLLAHHLQHLVAHGVLHLLGHDHEAEPDAEAMESIERAVMAALGAPDPYAADRNAEAPHG